MITGRHGHHRRVNDSMGGETDLVNFDTQGLARKWEERAKEQRRPRQRHRAQKCRGIMGKSGSGRMGRSSEKCREGGCVF